MSRASDGLDSSIPDSALAQAGTAVIQALVANLRALDDGEYSAWLSYFADDAEYRVSGYSSVLRHEQTFWCASKQELAAIIDLLPRQVVDPSRQLHIVGLAGITEKGPWTQVRAPFALYKTDPQGASRLFAVGTYDDSWAYAPHEGGRWACVARHVRLDTTELGSGSHVPI